MTLACLLAVLAAATPSLGQVLEEEDRFRAIEEGFDDLSPQAASTRLQHVDTRIPLDFARVYEIVDAPGLLARRSGAVTAVFPRSVYNDDASAPIPPGTVFYLGDLPLDLGQAGVLGNGFGDSASARGSNWIDRSAPTRIPSQLAAQRLDLRVHTGTPVTTPALSDPPGGSSMWVSEAYRQRRLEAILGGVIERAQRSDAGRAERPRDAAVRPPEADAAPPPASPPSGVDPDG